MILSPLTSHVDKVRALEGVIAEHDAITREISKLRELVEKMTMKSLGGSDNGWKSGEEGEEEFGGVTAEVNDDDSRSIRTIVPHELERSKRRTRSIWRSRKKRRMRSAG
jgi:hypothetical protein